MRVLAIGSILVLFIGLGYSFKITELLEPFNEGRQDDSDVGSQIVPTFTVAFIATVISNLISSYQPGMGLMWTQHSVKMKISLEWSFDKSQLSFS